MKHALIENNRESIAPGTTNYAAETFPSGARRGYTFGMKIAISVPDDVFEEAERLVRRVKRSRSEVYSQALREYVARHAPERITDAMNDALERLGPESDAFVSIAAHRILTRGEW